MARNTIGQGAIVTAATLLAALFGSGVSSTAQRPAASVPVPRAGNFVPVTDSMLEKPDPGDWLMWRRTLDGWGYSPLNQINKQNVAQLKMVWKREMTAGVQEATPLVYKGTMYLPNPADVTQAINGAT